MVHSRQGRKQSCRKRWYPSRAAAEQDIPVIDALDLSKPAAHRRKGKLHAYLCPACQKWHVGHERKSRPIGVHA